MSSQPQSAPSPGAGEAGSGVADVQALDELFTRLYDKIRTLARRVRWSGSNPTLNPTALAHEAYLKLRKRPPDFAARSREEVIAVFANAMQQILVDAARRKSAQKRLSAGTPERGDLPIEAALAITEAVERLECRNPLQARVVQCRFLLGMTVDETASSLGLSKRTVEREWQEAKARFEAT